MQLFNMPTWEDIQRVAREEFKIAVDEDEFMKIGFRYENGRKQMVTVSSYESMGHTWCRFASGVGNMDQIEAVEALRRNWQLGAGRLCLDGDTYVFRYDHRTDFLDRPAFKWGVEMTAVTADELEGEWSAGTDRF